MSGSPKSPSLSCDLSAGLASSVKEQRGEGVGGASAQTSPAPLP